MKRELPPSVLSGSCCLLNPGTTQLMLALSGGKATVRLDRMATRTKALRAGEVDIGLGESLDLMIPTLLRAWCTQTHITALLNSASELHMVLTTSSL